VTYALLALPFLALAATLAAAAALVRGRRRAEGAHRGTVRPRDVAVGAAALLVLTAVFDNVMIGVGLFSYAEERISGLRIGAAPLEDFAYPVAAVLLLPALWTLLGGERDR